MENVNRYKCHDIFMVRTPSLPINIYTALDGYYNENVENLIQEYNLYNFFEENLLVSSRNLYDSFEKYTIKKEEGKIKKIKNYKESLLKYIIRSSSRPTPFGGFSKVGLAQFRNSDIGINISKDLVTKKVNVDNSWLHFIINSFENNIIILKQLNLKINPLCYKYGDRFKNPFCSNLGNEKISSNKNNIKYSNLIQLIKEELKTFKSYEKLCLAIVSMYEGININIVNDTILKLIKSEFILTDLRINLLTHEPLKKLISKLEFLELDEKNKEILSKLKELDSLIFFYNNYNYDVNNIKKISSIMESIHKSNTYLMLNTGIKFNNNSIDINIKKDLEEFANIFKNLFIEKKYDNESVEDDFIEKYGLNIEVPFVDFIDPNGFDAIKRFKHVNEHNKLIYEREDMIKRLLEKKLTLSQINHSDEIIIEEKDIKDEIKPKTELPISFDLNVFITKDEMNNYNYFVGPNVGSDDGGTTFQRFEEVLDKKLFQEYLDIYDKKNKLIDDDYIVSEIREISSNGRITNIFNKTTNYNNYINFGFPSNDSVGEINVEDLSIGLDDNAQFYIKYKNNKKIKFVLDNMLNPSVINDVAYILYRISSNYNKCLIHRIFMFNDISSVYIPRVKIGKVTAFPKTWILDSDDFTVNDSSKFILELKNYINKFSIDKYVYLKSADNRLLINLEKDVYSNLILASLKKSRFVELSEVETNLIDGSMVVDECNNKYISEFVFTFIIENYKKAMQINKGRKIISENRCFNLFSDGWVYIKVYGVGDRNLDVLNSIENELRFNLDKHLFFFIRYLDHTGYHLRIRFKFESKESSIKNIGKISEWLEKIENSRMVNKVIFDVYERETNRYGGLNLISKAEELFESDSEFVISLLNSYNIENKEVLDEIYLFGVISILKTLTKDLDELNEILMDFDKLEYRKEFHKSNNKYVSFVENVLKDNFEAFVKDKTVLENYLSRKNKLTEFKVLTNNEKSCNNTEDNKNLFLSISHMFCNRLHGDRNYEERILSLAHLSVKTIINQSKYKQ
ncbi:thiopeptide-type bacteriocin biosynthesis protein [Clostridioides sp. ZZV15-6388]|uniref:lantibiotic dehydratase n=1 Tax=unclassified Clostridioides TaxID=2635829 RepID=UPI001D12066E|nr:thiopeptide-type bacteriocin biosynthesis protein [Clostridioides sp. ZZV15-6388]MCC0732724.1 thiopeptide-type bacteriocin biosynthesis protein [Clostridioides sp. ZZV14-6048]